MSSESSWIGVSLLAFSAMIAAPRVSPADEEVYGIATTVSLFDYGQRRFAVHPMLSNVTLPPELRQFRYEP
ncbi:MAG TPA: hypothetical protein VND64_30130, partial [Pirellulales bacterium]|nr:hypothetical protein [Pirellulales bacterium]